MDLPSRLFVVMGVCGCGKSSIGTALAEKFDATYIEGDALHPPANIELMSAGTPLTDEDRWPWLKAIGERMAHEKGLVFVGCSALRKIYRALLVETAGEPVCFIHLSGSRELIAEWMDARTGHFMPPHLLDSQLATLELPDDDELAISVDIAGSPEEIVEQIIEQMQNGTAIDVSLPAGGDTR